MITYRQSNFGQSAATGGPVSSVSATFLMSSNLAGNLGLAFICNSSGVGPTSVTDTAGNLWCPYGFYQTNVGWVHSFVCLSMLAAAVGNIVTATGTMVGNLAGGPDIVIMEFNVPTNAMVTAFQPFYNVGNNIPTGYATVLDEQGYTVNSMMVMFIYDQSGNSHFWSAINPPTQLDVNSFFQESFVTNYTGTAAYTNGNTGAGATLFNVLSSTGSTINDITVLGLIITEYV
jgi:hypothetical protein